MPEDKLVKIFFRFYSDLLEEETTETLSAEVFHAEHGYYKLETIPAYASKIAMGDIVWAEYNDAEGMLTYRKTIQSSGNSTIHVITMHATHETDKIRKIFDDMGCMSTKITRQYFALDIPPGINYTVVKGKLDELERAEIISYAESCLSDRHQYKNVSFGE
jgi:hypothetical protein